MYPNCKKINKKILIAQNKNHDMWDGTTKKKSNYHKNGKWGN
jgi:hypothetical protein